MNNHSSTASAVLSNSFVHKVNSMLGKHDALKNQHPVPGRVFVLGQPHVTEDLQPTAQGLQEQIAALQAQIAAAQQQATSQPGAPAGHAAAVAGVVGAWSTPAGPVQGETAGNTSTTSGVVGQLLPTSLPTVLQISAEFVMLASAGRAQAYHIASGDKLGKEGFIQYCSRHYGDVALLKRVSGGEPAIKTMSSGAYWWEWNDASKRAVRRVVMEPTSIAEGSAEADPTIYNTFPRLWASRPFKPETTAATTVHDPRIAPLYNHLMYLAGYDEKAVACFLYWCAFLYQHPGKRIPWAPLFCSSSRQIGKNAVLNMLRHVFICVGQCSGEQLIDTKFTDNLDGAWLMFINELPPVLKAATVDKLKTMVTDIYQQSEGKGAAACTIRRYMQPVVTTNHKDVIAKISGEQRFLVLGTDEVRRPDEYYTEFREWTGDAERAGPGVQALVEVLANMDFPADWRHDAPPYVSAYALEMDYEARSDLESEIAEMIEKKSAPFDRDFGAVDGLVKQIKGNDALLRCPALRDINRKTLGRAFNSLGHKEFRWYFDGDANATRARCWRNVELWEDVTPEQRTAHINNGTRPWEPPPPRAQGGADNTTSSIH